MAAKKSAKKVAPKTKGSKAKAGAKKPVSKVAAVKAKAPVDLASLDRKGLAARARQLKLELLAIRFNLQSPSLKDYRNKRRELATVLAQLG